MSYEDLRRAGVLVALRKAVDAQLLTKEAGWKAPAIGAGVGLPVGAGLGYLSARDEPQEEQIKRTLAGAGIGTGVGAAAGLGVGSMIKSTKELKAIRAAGENEAAAIRAKTKAIKEQSDKDVSRIRAERERIKAKGKAVTQELRNILQRGDKPEVMAANIDDFVAKMKKSHDLRTAGRLVIQKRAASKAVTIGLPVATGLLAAGTTIGTSAALSHRRKKRNDALKHMKETMESMPKEYIYAPIVVKKASVAAAAPTAGQVAKHVLTALGKVPGGARTAFKSMGEQVTRGAAMDPAAPGIIARGLGGTVAAVPGLATLGGAAYLAKPHIEPYMRAKLMQYRVRQAQSRPYYDPRVQRYM